MIVLPVLLLAFFYDKGKSRAMYNSTIVTYSDVDAYHSGLRGLQAAGIVTSRGKFRARLTTIAFEHIALHRSKESLPRIENSTVDPRLFGIVFPTRLDQPPAFIRGIEVSAADILVFGVASEGHSRSVAAYEWGSIALTHENLAAAGETLTGRELIAPAVAHGLRPPSYLLERLSNLHAAAGHLAETVPDLLDKPEIARAMEHALVDAMVACVARGEVSTVRTRGHDHGAVVRRLEEFLEANLDQTVYVQELCKATGVSYPTLRGCCQEQLGMSPKRYLWLRRMNLAHRALREADPVSITVTEIANAYGFWELGRFSVAYRLLFNEAPLVSLNRRPAVERKKRPRRPEELSFSA